MWMLTVDSSCDFLLQKLLIFHDDTAIWFTLYEVKVWPKLQFGIFGYFLAATKQL